MSNRPQDAHNPNRLPTLYFKLTAMRPSSNFHQRYDPNDNNWLPPRPLRSNVANSTTVWYKYEAGSISRMHTEPDSRLRQLYRTYSFYCSAQKILIYPADALRHQVGDGTGNNRVSQPTSPPQGEPPAHDSSSDTDVEDGRVTEDWRELAFTWHSHNGAIISHAATRGYTGTRLAAFWQDQGQIRELLPSRNHADGARIVQQGSGGMTGEIAILVALVIYSVPPDRIDGALRLCFSNNYRPHGLPHGHGWLDQRGLVVSVWHEKDRVHGSSSRTVPTTLTAAQKIAAFEEGRWPGYGKFVI